MTRQGLPAATTFSRQIPCDNASGANHRIRPDCDARTNYGASAKPDAIPNRHGQRVLNTRASCSGFNRMRRRVDVDAGRDLHFVADRDAIAVEKETVIVDERPVSDGYVKP